MSRSTRRSSVAVSLFSFQDIITCLSGVMIVIVLALSVSVASFEAHSPQSEPGHGDDLSPIIDERVDEQKRLQDDLVRLRERKQADLSSVETVRESIAEKMKLRELPLRLAELEDALRREQAELGELRDQLEPLTNRTDALKRDLAQLNRRFDALATSNDIFFIPEAGAAKSPILVECSSGGIRVGELMSGTSATSFPATQAGIRKLVDYARRRNPSEEYFVFMLKPSAMTLFRMGIVNEIMELDFDVGYDALEEHLSVGYGL